MCILRLAKTAEGRGDLRGAQWVGGRGAAEADAPSHFLLFSPFPVAQNLMEVGGIVPSQQSPCGPSVPLPEPHNGNLGPPSSQRLPLLLCLTPNPGHQCSL